MRLNIENEGECEGSNISYMCHLNEDGKVMKIKIRKNRSQNQGLFPSPIRKFEQHEH